jgi:ADP-dependent NAD(P)H-hydrate dehydratase / NAD(P)H-hydrate epimerase
MTEAILNSTEMQELERRAFAEGVSAEGLMDAAGAGMARCILERQPVPGVCIAYLGKGNNAGDAIVVAHWLQAAGWAVQLRLVSPEDQLGSLARLKLEQLGSSFLRLSAAPVSFDLDLPLICLDGLLGIGGRPHLAEEYTRLTRELNELRLHNNAIVYAIDVPTGVSDEEVAPDAVTADVTLTVAFPKSGLLRTQAVNRAGHIEIVPLRELSARLDPKPDRSLWTTAASLANLVPRRLTDSHKGDYGRLGVVAGSRGFVGAAVMTSRAALKAGIGLLTLYVQDDIYEIVAGKADPEVMVKPVNSLRDVLEDRLDAIAIGPGLGQSRAEDILCIVCEFPGPMVVDADALNVLARSPDNLDRLAGPRLLTPHPGEMSRLWPKSADTREETARSFTARYAVTLLLKGSHTIVIERDRPLAYNSTGTPAMATGGSGDLLTGVCGALIARQIPPYDAARLGAWLCGRAAELALTGESEESLLPEQTLLTLGEAYYEIRGV